MPFVGECDGRRAELKTLPGIGGSEADRTTRGQSHRSKAERVPRNVLPEGGYVSLRKPVIAKQATRRPVAGK